ncbi:hypothetical protein EV702DRAFT_138335 [Suillus placidus]|uniref:Uncharacterized protein n=1 Tax=Suillus placidus TaxID=48579 RepID=A0A9P6ZXV5_9AGAM|nr:hypothetical protein EV702DRAFT_138335 [Suillus placidus]
MPTADVCLPAVGYVPLVTFYNSSLVTHFDGYQLFIAPRPHQYGSNSRCVSGLPTRLDLSLPNTSPPSDVSSSPFWHVPVHTNVVCFSVQSTPILGTRSVSTTICTSTISFVSSILQRALSFSTAAAPIVISTSGRSTTRPRSFEGIMGHRRSRPLNNRSTSTYWERHGMYGV